ncbi:MAG: hypothetical protein WBF53_12840 [Litorimonas sp.]
MTDPARPFTEDLDARGHIRPATVPTVFHAPRSSIEPPRPASRETAVRLIARSRLSTLMEALRAHAVQSAAVEATGRVALEPECPSVPVTLATFDLADAEGGKSVRPHLVHRRSTDDLVGHLRVLFMNLAATSEGRNLASVRIVVASGRVTGVSGSGESLDLSGLLNVPAAREIDG